MLVVRDSSPVTFLLHAGPLLYQKEAEYCLALGLAEGLQSYLKPEITPLLLRIIEDGVTSAACVQTRRESVVVTHLNDRQAIALASYFREHKLPLPGATGPVPGVQYLCANYSSTPVHVRMSNRILQLTKVSSPKPTSGRLRVAGMDDFETACRFFHDFHVETLPLEVPTDDRLVAVIWEKIARESIFLWETEGVPVSCAHSTRPTREGISIGPVYTPPVERGKGYASNLVAALSQRLLDQGKRFCVLFTDIHNPTSNKIYERIGYRVIGASQFLSFA